MSRRSKRRGKRETIDHRDRWMITYADLITLLLIFFVIMYAMSNLDSGKYDVVTQSLQNTFNASDSILELGEGLGEKPGQTITETPPSEVQGEDPSKVKETLPIPGLQHQMMTTSPSQNGKNSSDHRSRNCKICSM